MKSVKVKKFICQTSTIGEGVRLSPYREITEIFDFKGNLIAQNEPYLFPIEALKSFIEYRFKDEEKLKMFDWVYSYFCSEDDENDIS